jgi:hypothetical protein
MTDHEETLTRQLLKADEKIAALHRLRENKYIPWVNTRGPDQCDHGVKRGIHCQACDQDLVR